MLGGNACATAQLIKAGVTSRILSAQEIGNQSRLPVARDVLITIQKNKTDKDKDNDNDKDNGKTSKRHERSPSDVGLVGMNRI
jgi:hypothetical protein